MLTGCGGARTRHPVPGAADEMRPSGLDRRYVPPVPQDIPRPAVTPGQMLFLSTAATLAAVLVPAGWTAVPNRTLHPVRAVCQVTNRHKITFLAGDRAGTFSRSR